MIDDRTHGNYVTTDSVELGNKGTQVEFTILKDHA